MNVTKDQVTKVAADYGLDYARVMAFLTVESGGVGFIDGKIVIQFEPTWFHKFLTQYQIAHSYTSIVDSAGKKKYVIEAKGLRIENGVQGQISEWESFNVAFKISPKAALLSTSIGLMQIMGFNYAAMGYQSVDAMWDDFKAGELQQIAGGVRFIKNNVSLYNALRNKDWAKVAYYYNGPNYEVNNYDNKLEAAYKKYSV